MAAGGVEWGRGGQSLGTRMRREKGFQKLGRVRGRAVASLAFLTVLMIALLGCTAVDLRWVFGISILIYSSFVGKLPFGRKENKKRQEGCQHVPIRKQAA
jgi:hypothetical protein